MAICECGKPNGRKKDGSLCGNCSQRMRRLLRKLALIERAGGRCVRCGWSGHPAGYEFHHPDPSIKEGDPCEMLRKYNWDRVLQEIDKCELLCATCHNIASANGDEDRVLMSAARRRRMSSLGPLHLGWLPDDVRDRIVEKVARNDERRSKGRVNHKRTLVMRVCGRPDCGNEFECFDGSERKYCSRQCGGLCAVGRHPKVGDGPSGNLSLDVLLEMNHTKTWEEISEDLGVSRRHLQRIRSRLSDDQLNPPLESS